ncbi:MAG: hypothetical protein IAE80_09160, partial [Anaerolinea sp.]|nr:hypothetical protein [Anaerolinea sp.]
ERLNAANALGWGAYFAVGLRRPSLTRWKRGGAADVIALPALFVDVDDPSSEALARLQCAQPSPSCIVSSGGGYHAYWWLNEPTVDLETARRLLRGLASTLQGDSLSVAQSLRIPSTINTKPQRHHALCHLIDLNERRYKVSDFVPLLPASMSSSRVERQPSVTAVPFTPNADLVARVTDELIRRGCKPRGEWLNGACPFPERHKQGDQHPSFGFNTRSAYGFCHVCGTLLLKDLCAALNVRPSDHGSIARKEVMPSSAVRVSSRILTH